MKNKIIGFLLLMPLLLITVAFALVENLNRVEDADRIILNHDALNVVRVDSTRDISYTVLPEKYKKDVIITSSDESIIEVIEPTIENPNWSIKGISEGEVVITASLSIKDSIIEDSVSFYSYNADSNKILVYDTNRNTHLIEDTKKYGEYDFDSNFNKVDATFNLRTIDVTGVHDINSAPSEVCDISFVTSNLEISQDPFSLLYTVKILDDKDPNGESYIEFKTQKEGYSTTEKYYVDIVDNSVNVYNYDDLMHCTNLSENGEIIVLQVNLESAHNTYMHVASGSKDYFDINEASKFRNTELFGKARYENNKYIYYMDDYKTMKSTYDTTYLDYINETYGTNISTDVKVGIELKQNLYGNGYTINMHSLTYPNGEGTQTSTGVTNIYPIARDPFQGPVDFVAIQLGESNRYNPLASVAGQDNIGLLVKGDNITISNVEIKSCNNVTHLSNLSYVGTTVEVMGNNCTIVNSLLANGRTVVRSFSNKDLLIKNSMLRYAKDFIIKVGSNTNYFSKEVGDYPSWSGEECYDNEITLDNVYTQSSGFFSIGVDAHFNGSALIEGDPMFLSGATGLGATSKGTKINLLNNTKFYDWKDYTQLDTSTLIQLSKAGEAFGDQFRELFNVPQMIRNALKGENEKFVYHAHEKVLDEEGNPVIENGVEKEVEIDYLHGGIAFYGGGKNYSTVINTEEELVNFGLSKLKDISLAGLLSTFSGTEPFNFYMYDNEATITPYSSPNINDLREYYYENKSTF